MEPTTGAPRFLGLGAWEVDGQRFEIASRRKLDTRIVLPFFSRDGELYAGVLERARPSRSLRKAPLLGLEAIHFDFARVDETADIKRYGRAMFTARAGVKIDDSALPIALPSLARSVGYLTELTRPLLQPTKPPPRDALDVAWDGGHHRILFRPVREWIQRLHADDAPPCGEEILTLLRALTAPAPGERLESTPGGDAFIARERERVWSAERLAASLGERADARGHRLSDPQAEDLQFLRLHRVDHEGRVIEVVTPGTRVSVSMLPYVTAGNEAYFILWNETRTASLERRARQPLYDLPAPLRYANATGFFMSPGEEGTLASDPRALAHVLLRRALGANVAVRTVERLGPAAEPASSMSTEVRHRLACALEAESLPALPADAFLISGDELARTVSRGLIKDPVIAGGLVALAGRLAVDPFARARAGNPARKRSSRPYAPRRRRRDHSVQRRHLRKSRGPGSARGEDPSESMGPRRRDRTHRRSRGCRRTNPGATAMKLHALLSTLVLGSVAGCGGSSSSPTPQGDAAPPRGDAAPPDCMRRVVDRETTVALSSQDACDLSFAGPFVMSEVQDVSACRTACNDPQVTNCSLPPINPAERSKGVDGGPNRCTWPTLPVVITCLIAHTEGTAPYGTIGCVVAGRLTEGLSPHGNITSLATYFVHCADLEGISVASFDRLARELRAIDAPEALARRAERAALEEVGHARSISSLANRFGADVPPVVTPTLPLRRAFAIALENAVEGAVRETFGAAVALHQAHHARDRSVRAVYLPIADDERSHAELALDLAAYFRTVLSPAERAAIDEAQRAAITELRRDLAEPLNPILEREAGLPSSSDASRILDGLDAALWTDQATA
jgi:hypothetical protein